MLGMLLGSSAVPLVGPSMSLFLKLFVHFVGSHHTRTISLALQVAQSRSCLCTSSVKADFVYILAALGYEITHDDFLNVACRPA